MADKLHGEKINTDLRNGDKAERRMPHERDESPDQSNPDPRGIMKQAASDVEQGLVDTDLHGKPDAAANVDTGAATGSGQAKPQADAADSMRFTTDSTKTKGNNL